MLQIYNYKEAAIQAILTSDCSSCPGIIISWINDTALRCRWQHSTAFFGALENNICQTKI